MTGTFSSDSDGAMRYDFHYLFSTKYRDEYTWFYDYGYRWYWPDIGRWLNRDPIEEEGDPNVYLFCKNSIIYIDVVGKQATDQNLFNAKQTAILEEKLKEAATKTLGDKRNLPIGEKTYETFSREYGGVICFKCSNTEEWYATSILNGGWRIQSIHNPTEDILVTDWEELAKYTTRTDVEIASTMQNIIEMGVDTCDKGYMLVFFHSHPHDRGGLSRADMAYADNRQSVIAAYIPSRAGYEIYFPQTRQTTYRSLPLSSGTSLK